MTAAAHKAAGFCELRQGPWESALADVETCEAVIVDAPYSARTHGGHDSAPTVGGHRSGGGAAGYETYNGHGVMDATYERRAINYGGWTPADVAAFVDHWAPRCSGWMVTITDHNLAPAWDAAMAAHGRYVFAPLPWYAPGSRVRLLGDGPSCWTCWIVVSRPSSGEFADGTKCNKWGTLPGGYNITSDRGSIVVGAKPLALMRALVRDYTRPGDLVVDPCAGGGTTLLASAWEGRRSVGSELDFDTFGKAAERLARELPSAERWAAIRDEQLWRRAQSMRKGRRVVRAVPEQGALL